MSTVEDITRVPPQDLEAEQAVLGGMLLSKDAIMDVLEEGLIAEDFYRPAHAIVFGAIVALHGDGEPADPITVKDRLHAEGMLSKVGGPSYLHGVVQQVPTAANAAYYAEIVRNKARLRKIIEACGRVMQMCYAAEGEIEEITDQAGEEMFAALAKRTASQDWLFLRDAVPGYIDELEERGKHKGKLTGISTGFIDLDNLTGGFQPGQFVLVAARPAMGKSVLATNFVQAFAKAQEEPTVLFSLEMGRNEILERYFSASAKVAMHHLRLGELTDSDWTRITEVTPDVMGAPVIVDDSVNLTALDIRSKSRRIKEQYGLSAVVVDYAQLMKFGAGSGRNRQEEVSEISRSLKVLGKELGVPVIALSQLNRKSTERESKIPEVSDLRESGSLEQDADIVILIHREDVYDKESPRAGEADLIVGKHRNGPTATITVAFQGHYARFVDMAPDMITHTSQ